MKRWVSVVAMIAALLVAGATPAAAHGGALQATDHRAELLGLEPDIDGVSVRLVDGGTRIELDAGSHEVVVLGYEDEPYLRIDERGVFENRRSPAVYLNRSLNGDTPPPDADADAPPSWERVASGTTVRWHDHALHVPPGQRAGTRAESRWARPLEVDGVAVELQGRIVTSSAPSRVAWLLVAAAAAAAVVLAGWLAWSVAIVAALALLVAADAARLYGLVFGAPTWLVSRVDALADDATLSVIGWGLAIAAVVLVRTGRRLEATAAATVAGGVLAFTGGILELGDLGSAHLGSALGDGAARAAIALTLGLGAGIAASALLELRRASSTPARRTRRTGSAPTPGDGTRTGSSSRPSSG